ncbi:hypothetical protein [Granulicella sibirica]|uniref:Uncharacterized protein n=1 Tax=Granulicella sibirica TaxID=2479048 RepID=A0A4Q0T062_9BACT|nr:hypothetical protein [Granulicella sibirica]RXH54756.1 hypothetical protein GRAN_3860 [Granulicella sibirica]
MAQRSLITGIVAAGIAAAAMRVGTSGPSPQLGGSSGSAATASSHRHTSTLEETMAKIDWTEDLKRHPKETGQRSAAKELDDAIADFYTPRGSEGESAPKPSSTAQCSDLEVMIAIEPDPAHTRLALWFDRDLDTLGDALQESGYQYQGNWMPWSAEGSSSAPGDRFLDRQEQRLFFEGREQMPGVLLYRPGRTKATEGACPPKSLEVFVVGNSPTSGINGTQFREAIRQFARRSNQQEKLKILGPSFSGSGPSLRSLIEEIPTLLAQSGSTSSTHSSPTLKSVEVASGSITDPDCSHFLPGAQQASGGCSVMTGNIQSSFVSFAPDSYSVIKSTEDFLTDNAHGNIEPSRIAVLTEDESNFGLNIRDASKPTANGSATRSAAGTEERSKVLNVTYPRGISHLRTAYQKSSIWGFGGTTEGSGSVNLNLDFDETTIDEDSVPVFAHQQMPVSQESNVYQLTTMLRERGIQAVILSGTDVLDVIFVAQILARQAPNLLIVIWEADDLFLRSATNSVFRNIYFVGSWPLISENYFWSLPAHQAGGPPATQFRNFTSDNAEGFHTAVHYLLRDSAPQDGSPVLDLPDYHSPFRRETFGHPPLWLCSEDNGRFWPVALLDANAGDTKRSNFHLPDLKLSREPAGLDQPLPPPASQRFFLVILSLLSLAHLYFCLDFKLPKPQGVEAHYLTNDRTTRTAKLLLLLGINLVGVFMLAVLLPPPARLGLLSASTALPFAISMLCLSTAATLLLGRLPSTSPGKWTYVPLFLVVVAGTTSFWLLLWRILPPSMGVDGMHALFAYRVTQPLSGASPVHSLFLASAGLAYVLYSHLGRLNFTSQLAPRLPDNSGSIPNIPNQQGSNRVTSLLHYPPTRKQWGPKALSLAILSVTALLLCCAADVSPRVFDGRATHVCLELLLSLVLVAILWDLAMAFAIWSNLSSHILQPLENSSLRRAFNAIGGLTWKSFWMPQNSVSQYRAIFRLLEQAERKPLLPESQTIVSGGKNLQQKAVSLWKEYKRSPRLSPPVLQAFDDVQQGIQTLADSLLDKLHIHWSREVVSITAPDLESPEEGCKCPEKPSPTEARHLAREEWVALVYLHFSRMVLAQIRSRLMTAAVLYFFLVWACTSYPFLNRHLILIALSVTLGILSAVGITIFASINRDAVLSRVTKNTPGELDWDFLIKTASLIGIPILSFVATQFPELGSFLFSWIQPGMTSLK